MSAWGYAAIVAAGIISNMIQSQNAKSAAKSQKEAALEGIGEQRRQFESTQDLLAPFVGAGEASLAQLMGISGAGGPEAEQAAIKQIERSPEFQALAEQGETGILQSASATGGLRGGNVQAALAQFRPELLSGLVNQRFGRLSQLAGIGQASAAGVGNIGQATATNIGNLFGRIGSAEAQSAYVRGQSAANLYGSTIPYAIGGYLGSQDQTDDDDSI
jgi:hypothetical protein